MDIHFPRGVEVLIKKASIDGEFRQLFLADRLAAAEAIGLQLEPPEAAMLAAVPAGQLQQIIAQTTVPEPQRRVFLGKVAATMLAALAATESEPVFAGQGATGIRPESPKEPPRTIEQRMLSILVAVAHMPNDAVSSSMPLADLKLDPAGQERLCVEIESAFGVTLTPAILKQMQTVADLIDEVEAASAIAQRVIDLITQRLKLKPGHVTPKSNLADDLKISRSTRLALRELLSREFRVFLDGRQFGKLATVADVVAMVAAAVEKKEAAEAAKKQQSQMLTRGIRPDVPIKGAMGGIRPGNGGTFGNRPN